MLTIEEVIENFEFLDDWDARYAYLVELGEQLPALSEQYRTEANRVQGCMSRVWVCALQDQTTDTIHYVGDCDTSIIKGVLALLIGIMSEHSAAEIEAMDIDILFDGLKLKDHLSPNRHFGIYGLVELMKQQARDCAQCATNLH